MEKNCTLASPEMARASRVLPVPGGPMSSTPLGILPPSLTNLAGSLRNSTISCSSSLASSQPATSAKVTRRAEVFRPRARALPKLRALLPPIWAWRMNTNQSTTNTSRGPQNTSMYMKLFSLGLAARNSSSWPSCFQLRMDLPRSCMGGAMVLKRSKTSPLAPLTGAL